MALFYLKDIAEGRGYYVDAIEPQRCGPNRQWSYKSLVRDKTSALAFGAKNTAPTERNGEFPETIVDVHAHAFPPLRGASGYKDQATHLDHIRTEVHTLLPEGYTNLRVSQYGKLAWTRNGKEETLRLWPPFLVDMSCPPELMLEFMDWVGVDMAVLYQAHVYGSLNQYLAECVNKYPDRFVAVAQINESEAGKQTQIEVLRHCANDLRLSGLYYEIDGRVGGAQRSFVDDEEKHPLWEEVMTLRLPVIFDIEMYGDKPQDYLDTIRRIERVLESFPSLVGILAHNGCVDSRHHIDNPRELFTLLKYPNMYVETVFAAYVPAVYGGAEEYPYPSVQKIIKAEYDEFGAEKLLWGSDAPAVLGACTYKQCLDVIRLHCSFISEQDMKLILGDNAARLFNLAERRARTDSSMPVPYVAPSHSYFKHEEIRK
jgi:predicted TIM-barrel fold metal-dependent hydrolase